MTEPIFSWPALAKGAIALAVGIVGGVFVAGRTFGISSAQAESQASAIRRVEDTATTHESRIVSLEKNAATTTEAVSWIKEALRTGRDPVTKQPLGR